MTKKTKRVLLTAISAILLVVLSVGVTLAYLTDTDVVNNTFTVGNVDIILDEADVYEFGDDIPGDYKHGDAIPDAKRVKTNNYKIFPNHNYVKDPTVTVLANSEDCYVRAFVTVSNSKELDAIFDAYEGLKLNNVVTGISKVWEVAGIVEDTKNNTRTYEVRYPSIVASPDEDKPLDPLFLGLHAPEELTNIDLASLKDLTIDVYAQAIQADGFDDADAAWLAYEKSTVNK